VIVGDTVTKVLVRLTGISSFSWLARRETVIAAATMFITLPLSLFRDIARLSKVSLLSLLFMIVIFIGVLLRLTTMQHIVPQTSDAWAFANTGVFQATGIMAFAFMCHHNTFLLYDSLREPTQERWNKVTHFSIVTSLIVCILMGVGGYATFTGHIQGDLLENYCWHDDLMNTIRFLFSITILLTYPIEAFVAREVIENAFFLHSEQPAPRWRHASVTFCIVVVSFILSLSTDCLGLVLELNGILAAVPLAFILPALSYCKLESGSWFKRPKLPALLLSVFGTVVAVLGAIMMFGSEQTVSCRHGKQMEYCIKNGSLVDLNHL